MLQKFAVNSFGLVAGRYLAVSTGFAVYWISNVVHRNSVTHAACNGEERGPRHSFRYLRESPTYDPTGPYKIKHVVGSGV